MQQDLEAQVNSYAGTLVSRIQKKVDELEKEKYKMSIDGKRLAEIDAQLNQYMEMLERIGNNNE